MSDRLRSPEWCGVIIPDCSVWENESLAPRKSPSNRAQAIDPTKLASALGYSLEVSHGIPLAYTQT